MVISDAFGDLSLKYLKDVVGRSLAAFPTSTHHTTAARSRKAHRLVGARLDFLARDLGFLSVNADEYAFAEYGPAGGDIVLFRSGPPLSVLGIASLKRDDAEKLYTAADLGPGGLDVIDAILRCALTSIHR
jgi:hypothetical protein